MYHLRRYLSLERQHVFKCGRIGDRLHDRIGRLYGTPTAGTLERRSHIFVGANILEFDASPDACLSREPMRRLQKATHAVIHLTNTRVVINQSCVTGEGSMSSPRAAHISHSHHFYQTGYTMPRSYLALSQQIPLLSRALMLGPSLPNTELIRLVIIRHLPSQLFLREGVEDMWKLRDEKQLTSSTHITRLGWMISLAASLLSVWRLPLEFAISTQSSFTAVAKNF